MIAAIDPGLNGALAVIDGQHVVLVDHLPVLRVQHGRGAKVRHELDVHRLKDMLTSHPISHVYLERVSARPGQGVVSMFRFAEAAGAAYGVTVGLGLATTFVSPRVWQRFHGIGGEPDAARQRAVQLFPDISALLTRKRDDQRADAILLAAFGMQTMIKEVAASEWVNEAAWQKAGAPPSGLVGQRSYQVGQGIRGSFKHV